MLLTLLPAPKWTKLTPDVRQNIVIEYVKKNGRAFSIFEKIATEAQLRTANSICPEAICVYIAITLSSFIRMGWNLVFRFSVSSIVYVSRWIWLTTQFFDFDL